MILFDTNVLSEFARSKPHPVVLAWLDTIPRGSIAIPFSAVAEIQKGISDLMLTNLKKGIALQRWLNDLLASNLHFIPMDKETARILGSMYATPALRDLWIPGHGAKAKMKQDLAIAASAIAHRVPIATRNTSDFVRIHEHFPLRGIVNPFEPDWLHVLGGNPLRGAQSESLKPRLIHERIDSLH